MRRRMLATADLIAAAAVSLIVVPPGPGTVWALAVLPGWILIAKLLGLYDRDHRAIRHLTIDEVPVLMVWAAVGTAAMAAALTLTPQSGLTTHTLVATAAMAALVAFVLRGVARAIWRRTTPRERSLVVGDGELGAQIERKLTLFSDMHLEPVGTIGGLELELILDGYGQTRVDALVEGADRVIVASGLLRTETIVKLSMICRDRQIKLSVVSTLHGRATPAPRITQVADLPILEFNTWDVSRSTMVLKRLFDLAGSAALLTLTVPLFPLIALAIKIDSRGPVFFRQKRAGIGGRPFRIFKFRTMDAGAEERLHELVQLDQLEHPMFKLESDPRVTRVGRFLRHSSLDELPQLLNVLRGDMSLVGPRPEQLDLVARYLPEDRIRLDVKPGITGPMQVNGRGSLTFPERLAVEADYIEHMSLARDLRLVALTAVAVFRRNGAF